MPWLWLGRPIAQRIGPACGPCRAGPAAAPRTTSLPPASTDRALLAFSICTTVLKDGSGTTPSAAPRQYSRLSERKDTSGLAYARPAASTCTTRQAWPVGAAHALLRGRQ